MPEELRDYTIKCAIWSRVSSIAGVVVLTWFSLWEITAGRWPSAMLATILLIWWMRYLITERNHCFGLHFSEGGLKIGEEEMIPWTNVRNIEMEHRVFGHFKRPYLRVDHETVRGRLKGRTVDLLYMSEDPEVVLSHVFRFWRH